MGFSASLWFALLLFAFLSVLTANSYLIDNAGKEIIPEDVLEEEEEATEVDQVAEVPMVEVAEDEVILNISVTIVIVNNTSRETANCTRKKEENCGAIIATQEDTMMVCVSNYIQIVCPLRVDLDNNVDSRTQQKAHLQLLHKRHLTQQLM